VTGRDAPRIVELTRRLTEAEATIQALLSGQIDAVVDPESRTPVLLAKAQQALRDERDRAQRYLDTADVILLALDTSGRVTQINRKGCDVLGWTEPELVGRDFLESCVPARLRGATATRFSEVIAGDLSVVEATVLTKSGDERLIEWRNTLQCDSDGTLVGTFSSGADITERRGLEEQYRQSQKMEAIGLLASGVAHDFNNMLTVILGFTEFVAAELPRESRHTQDLGEVIKAAQSAASLTRQLLAFSRQQVLNAAPLDLNGLITDMTAMLGRLIGEHIEITLRLAPDLPMSVADRSQLEQVIMNLVVNARDAMPEGGRLTIETTQVTLESSSFHREEVVPGHYVQLAISDTGVGMTPETQRRLFEPFFTTKEKGKGTGLGLSTSYGIVKQSKGHIAVDSGLGRGTTFKVFLPSAPFDAAVPAASPAAPLHAARASGTVLLVEDETGVRLLSRRILERGGYRVLEASNGDDAERIFAEHGATIDLVVSDVVMPGCGGPELVARLRIQTPAVRVLYMSGYAEQAAARTAGIDRGAPFIEKPFTAAGFLRDVGAAMAR
jgi:two-component system, cell cycle sensor histidine kinase and response regulator CckA